MRRRMRRRGGNRFGFLIPRKNGTTSLVVKAGPASVTVPVTVVEMDKPQPVSFRQEFIAALNVGGCNSGACHGTPSGKNGFKLSLRGFDPGADFVQLTHDVQGRRTDRHQPEASLVYQKALGRVPHDGMQRFPASSVPALAMRDWIAEGLQDDPASLPALKSIQILPGTRILKEPARWQQLAVLAHFADGKVRDVTRLTVFSSSDTTIADVNSSGMVEFKSVGEVAILCRYLEELQTVRLTFLQPREGFVWPNPQEANYVDKHVFAKLKMLSIPPSDVCSDGDYVRRAYLDVCGVLPTPDEVRTFLDSKDSDKRAKLVDALGGAAGVRRLLDPQMERYPSQQSQDDSSEGHSRLPALAARPPRSQHRLRVEDRRRSDVNCQRAAPSPIRRRTITAWRKTRRISRRRRCSFSSAFACNVPSATTIRSSAGRRTITTAWPRSSRG